MLIYLGVIVASGSFNKNKYVGRGEKQTNISLNIYIPKGNILHEFILIFLNQFKYCRVFTSFQGHRR